MTAKSKQEDIVSALLLARWTEIGNKLETLAAKCPEGKLEYRPVESVRTFGEVLRHVAFWNRYVADSLLGNKADDSANEVPLADCPTKTQMIRVVEESSAQAAAALEQSAPDAKTAEMVMAFIEHTAEHYGQLVVYSRLLGFVPPASRG